MEHQHAVSAIAIILKTETNVASNNSTVNSFVVLFRTNRMKYFCFTGSIVNDTVRIINRLKRITTPEIRSYISHNRKMIYDVIPLTYIYDDTRILRYVNCCGMFLSISPSITFEREHNDIIQSISTTSIHELISGNKNPFGIISTMKNVMYSQTRFEPRLMTLTDAIYKKFRKRA